MFDFLKNVLGGNKLTDFKVKVDKINALETEIGLLSDLDIKERSSALKKRIKEGEILDEVLPEAFALVREAAKRTLGQRPFDVQLIGGMVLHEGAVAEMVTGEGKTLAAVAPAYLNALSEDGVHVVTVNEYLARRDAVWMGQIYAALGLKVACLVPNAAFIYDPSWKIPEGEEILIDKERDVTGSFRVQQEFLRPASRREAYLADVVYGTNHEFGFDYLRDNLTYRLEDQVQRGWNYAIIDEVDSILIDEARTPLIIAAPDSESSEYYKVFARVVQNLSKDEDFTVDEKFRAANITESGIEKVEKILGVKNIYAPENIRLVRYLEESLRAKALFQRDKDYVVKNGEVVIVDEFTGRMLFGRRYQGGLHQAIEAKEGVQIKQESRTYAKISIQNYFRLYKKIAGMTGTAQTSAEEFHKVYNLDVVSVPTNKPLIRKNENDLIYKNIKVKYEAVVREVGERYKKGQPVLLGTTSIEKNELISALLSQAAVPHEVLNAKNNEREGAIIAQAGKPGAVTVATNMAGRGVDIILGGNPPSPEGAAKVREVGGLHVIGTERHEARRIDNQLRGRAGRQGDPGSSQFFLSLEDDLLRIFGGDRIKGFMERFNMPDDQPIELGFVSKAVAEAQAKVEGANFDLRKHLLEYDDILNRQRSAVYRKRREFLGILEKEKLAEIIVNSSLNYLDSALAQSVGEITDVVRQTFESAGVVDKENPWPHEPTRENLDELLKKRAAEATGHELAKNQILGVLDALWMNHLEELEAVSESVGLRAYGQKDPLVEYRHEAHRLYQSFWNGFDALVFLNIFKLSSGSQSSGAASVKSKTPASPAGRQNLTPNTSGKVGRNNPCPCGAKKVDGRPVKYKHCHGKNL